jgi:hypothetical protein
MMDTHMDEISNWKHPHRAGKWLPADQHVLEGWLAALIDHVTKKPTPLHPVIEDFKALIEGDAQVYMLFHMMLSRFPGSGPTTRTRLASRKCATTI